MKGLVHTGLTLIHEGFGVAQEFAFLNEMRSLRLDNLGAETNSLKIFS